jgi:hypothetical protein
MTEAERKVVTTLEMIQIMQAFADGKPIQSMALGQEGRFSRDRHPHWAWSGVSYRISPEGRE